MLAAAAAMGLAGCASTYSPELIQQHTASLYGSSPAPNPETSVPIDAEQPAAPWDLAQCLDYGLAHHAGLRAAYESWLAQTEAVESAGTLPDPKLAWGEFLEEIQTRTGPQQRRIGLSQAFPWPGLLKAQSRKAQASAEAAWFQVEAMRLQVQERITHAYHEYAFFGQELRITGELLDLLHGLEPVVQSRVRSGQSQEHLLRLQIEIGRMEDALASLERRRPMLSARLAEAMNLSDRSVALPVPELADPQPSQADAGALYALALERNPQLRALDQQLAAASDAEALAQLRRKPSFSAGVDWIQTGAARDPSTPGSGEDPVLVSVSMTLPVWGSAYASSERGAHHQLQATRQQRIAQESSLRADLEASAYQWDDALRRIRLYRDSLVPRAHEALDLTLSAYTTGSASILDLLDAEQTLIEFELSHSRAKRDALQSRAQLEALIAQPLPQSPNGDSL